VSIEGPGILDKPLDGVDITMGTSPDTTFPASIYGNDWEILENANTPTFATRSYYDTSGYNIKQLTCFFQGVDIQEGWGPRGTAEFFVVDLITTQRMTSQQIIDAHIFAGSPVGDLPGFPRSTFDMSQVIYGRTRQYLPPSTDVQATQYSTTSWGTCTATSADKIYLTRIVYLEGPGAPGPGAPSGSVINIPACDYVTAIIVAEEKDLQYIMRQKRSFETAR